MLECVVACSALDTSAAAASASDAGVQSLGDRCPEPPFPCERLCWELDARGGAFGATRGDTDLAELGEPAIRCALERAEECRAGAVPVTETGSVTGAVPDSVTGAVPAEEALSWTRLFLDCAGLPADIDVFD